MTDNSWFVAFVAVHGCAVTVADLRPGSHGAADFWSKEYAQR
jgi:hypothetical protein